MMGADADPSGSPDDRDFAAPADAPARAASGAAREVQAARAAWADERGRARAAEARASGSDEPEARADGRSRGDRARTYDSFDDTSGARTSKETTPAADRDPSPAAPFSRARDATHGAVEEGEGFTVRELPNPSARAASERSSERVPAPDENRDADDDADDDDPDAPVAPSSGKAGPRASLRAASEITQEDLSSCFHLPSEAACRKLGIGLTVLKRQCRKFGIKRWPFRKMKSLDRLITNVQAGISPGDQNRTLVKSVEELEEQKARMQDCEELDLDEDTKKLQQAYSKANHKARRMAAEGANAQDNRLFSDLGGLLALGSPAAAGGGADAAAAAAAAAGTNAAEVNQALAAARASAELIRGVAGVAAAVPGLIRTPSGGAVPSAPRDPIAAAVAAAAAVARARPAVPAGRLHPPVSVSHVSLETKKNVSVGEHNLEMFRKIAAMRAGAGAGAPPPAPPRTTRSRRGRAPPRSRGSSRGARKPRERTRTPSRHPSTRRRTPRPRPRSSPPPPCARPGAAFRRTRRRRRRRRRRGARPRTPCRACGRPRGRRGGARRREPEPPRATTTSSFSTRSTTRGARSASRRTRTRARGARARTRSRVSPPPRSRPGGEAAGGGEAEEGAEGGAGGGGGGGGRRRHSRRRTRRWSR